MRSTGPSGEFEYFDAIAFEFRASTARSAYLRAQRARYRNSRFFLLSDRATAKEGQSAKGENARRTGEGERESRRERMGQTEGRRKSGVMEDSVRVFVVRSSSLRRRCWSAD